ncbi:Clp1/GlmU family protein [Methanoculleus sp.]|uniref:Clp1/GlmU family protein n=1 Tax=Methanoculleus sp. TaxID=90427 RepID=UPI0025EF1D9B|nr:Clp1/GlmU family protein [Methanoculleus sp.]MCK9318625.1 AAA family ATPase [Methanoculleus sp.]MDD2254016.1 Clp1/GlmU family protein [Methanoculleus sp.]MDD4314984.1 Clp1/GlmU family protein [Methanoculleus sp.]HOI58757.1 Clp1/GlmU family protein [Methanoculleus sp.]
MRGRIVATIRIGEGWEALVAALLRADAPERVYVVGATDSGKTMLCRYIVDETAPRMSTAYVDCDTGQSRIGPPTTEGMLLYPGSPEPPGLPYLRFIGSTSPGGHFIQTLTGAKRLVEKAAELGAGTTVIDSPGLVSGGVGAEFQFQMIDLLHPTRLVVLQRGRELERLLANFSRRPAMTVHRIPVSSAAVARTAVERRRYREERLKAYFADARLQEVPLSGLGLQGRVPDLKNPRGAARRLVSLNDPESFTLALGIAGEVHPQGRVLEVVAPPFDPAAIASVRFGSIYLDLAAEPGHVESCRP